MNAKQEGKVPQKITHGHCHCGAAHWTFHGEIPDATICNCTACRRYGALWAYDYEGHGIHVTAPKDGLTSYVRGSGSLSFNFWSAATSFAGVASNLRKMAARE